MLTLGRVLRALNNAKDTKQGILIVRWIARIYSTVMGRSEARYQLKKDVTNQLSALIKLLKDDLSFLPKSVRSEVIANTMKSFRLFTSSEASVNAILNYYPNFLNHLAPLIIANNKNPIIQKEAAHIIKNFMRNVQ